MSINPFKGQAPIPGIQKIVVVGSGKGGVGKSTISANLAAALAKKGQKVGLLDADIYGPSIPRLFGAINQPPPLNADKKIEPLIRNGLKIMSMGFLVDEGSAIVWRGPMLFKAIEQLLKDVVWGELDYLIIDLPPGTGDVVLTVAQKVPITGAVVVCTPQNLALVDARKALDMFDQIHVPTLGVVENMAYFKSSTDSEPIALFPKGDLDSYLDAKRIKKLAQIPFYPQIGMTSEAGMPLVISAPQSEETKIFLDLADTVMQECNG
jgi:ATP-binding protein involved in chromosome partitioning